MADASRKEIWIMGGPDLLSAEPKKQWRTKRLLQECKWYWQNHARTDGDGQYPWPIRDLCKEEFRGTGASFNLQFSDFDFAWFKDAFLPKQKFDVNQHRLEFLQHHAPWMEWEEFALTERNWISSFEQQSSVGVEDWCFRFRMVPHAMAKNTLDTRPIPAPPPGGIPDKDNTRLPSMPLAQCKIVLCHEGFAPEAREIFSIRELGTPEYLANVDSLGAPRDEMTRGDLSYQKWRDVIVKRLNKPTNKEYSIKWIHPQTWYEKAWDVKDPDETEDDLLDFHLSMKTLVKYKEYPGRDKFYFQLYIPSENTEDFDDYAPNWFTRFLMKTAGQKKTAGQSGGVQRSGAGGQARGAIGQSGGSSSSRGSSLGGGSSSVTGFPFINGSLPIGGESDEDTAMNDFEASPGEPDPWSRGGEADEDASKNKRSSSATASTSRTAPRFSVPLAGGGFATASAPTETSSAGPITKGRKRSLSPSAPGNSRITRQKTQANDSDSSSDSSDEEPDDKESDKEGEESDGEEEDGNDFVEKFLTIADVTESSQMEDNLFTNFCAFFKLQPKKAKKPKCEVNLEGVSIPFRVYQAFAIYWMLDKEYDTSCGGFLADEQGLGKTITALGLCILERVIHLNYVTTMNDIRSKDPLRLQRHATGSAERICPTESYSIKCQCSKGYIHLDPNNNFGPTLIIAPKQLLKTWRDEFEKLIDSSKNPLNMKMIVAHPTEGRTYTKKALEDLLQEAEIYGENTSNLIIATTSGSFKKQVGDVVGRKIKWRRVIRDELHLEKTPATKNIKLMLSETAKRRRGPTSMWALSGTPFERSPKDLAGYISVLRTGAENAWEIDGRDELKFGLAAPFQEIDTKYNKLIKDAQKGKTLRKVDIEGVLGKFGKILHALMIRRTMSSSWFGKVLLDVPESEHQDLSFTVSSAYKNDLDWLRECAQHNLQRAAAARQTKASTKFSQPKAQSRASGTEYQKYGRRLRLAATIPAIPGLLRKKEILDDMFLQETILKQGWYDNGPNYNASPYKKYLTQFVQSSEKFTLINQHVLQVLRTPKDPENPEKIIIMSSFPAMAFITALWLKKGKHSVLFIHSALKNRATLVNDFQGVMREDTDEAKRPKTTTKGTKAESERDAARKASILVSTIQLIGTGFTITRATHVVMLEPAWMLRDEKQGYARIRRFSQKNPTFTWKLINNDSFVEPQIMQRHAARGRFVELSFGDNTDQQDFGRNAPQDFDIVDEDKGVAGSKKPAARYTDKQHEDSDEEVDGYSSGEEFEF